MKSGRIEKILVSLICVWLEGWKSGEIENFFVWLQREIGGLKMEFVRIYSYVLIKNNAQLREKKGKQTTKKNAIIQSLLKRKIHVQ